MTYVVDIESLQADGWLDDRQAREIVRRSRDTLVHLAINCVLFAGIIVATLGLIFWLADPVAVAVAGTGFLIAGLLAVVLARADFRMLANASAVIGAGMLLGGLAVEMLKTHSEIADPVMIFSGAAVLLISALFFWKGPEQTRFLSGAVLVMGIALHLVGLGNLVDASAELWRIPAFFYAAAVIGAAGVLLDVRLVTAFAVFPLAGALATRAGPFDLDIIFFPPDAALTLLLMSGVAGASLWLARGRAVRLSRHFLTVATLAFLSVNLCFFHGSLDGDGFGKVFFERPVRDDGLGLEDNAETFRTYRRGLFFIPEDAFILSWFLALVVSAVWAARRNLRGVFNTSIVFGAIHVAGQVLERNVYDPAVWAAIGLAIIPVAWGMWKANLMMSSRDPAPS
jgi:hypothetical protein